MERDLYTMEQITASARTTSRAVRIWSEKGLLGDVKRNERGERVFTEDQRQRARVISAAQMAGMSLSEIKAAPHVSSIRFEIAKAFYFLKDVHEQTDAGKVFDL